MASAFFQSPDPGDFDLSHWQQRVCFAEAGPRGKGTRQDREKKGSPPPPIPESGRKARAEDRLRAPDEGSSTGKALPRRPAPRFLGSPLQRRMAEAWICPVEETHST